MVRGNIAKNARLAWRLGAWEQAGFPLLMWRVLVLPGWLRCCPRHHRAFSFTTSKIVCQEAGDIAHMGLMGNLMHKVGSTAALKVQVRPPHAYFPIQQCCDVCFSPGACFPPCRVVCCCVCRCW